MTGADESLVRRAIALAREARAAGNHPFGALLAIDGAVVLTAKNTVHTDKDATAHAETNLVAGAIRRLTPEKSRAASLYHQLRAVRHVRRQDVLAAGIRAVVYAAPRASWRNWPAAASWCRAETSSRARRIASR